MVQAAERLVESLRRRGIEPGARDLNSRIVAFELYARASNAARLRVVRKLVSMRVHRSTATSCAKAWIRTGDFLLSEKAPDEYTHVVGNPPYVRWSKVPARLRKAYEERLPSEMARGDLYLPFLDRAFDELKAEGKLGFVCSDRWQYAVYGRGFRRKWLSRLDVLSNRRIEATEAFMRKVSAHANVLVASKRTHPKGNGFDAGSVHQPQGKSLADRGCVIRVGPALGVTSAFVVDDKTADLEPDLLLPWVDSSEVLEGRVDWRGRFVASLFDENGGLRDLREYPRLARHLARFRGDLEARYIVRHGAPWYRTIDRLRAADWQRPKILVPEIAKEPRVALDCQGLVPSHGVYAVFPPKNDVEGIYEALRDGGLGRGLKGIAPTLKNGYVRCYKKFLSAVRDLIDRGRRLADTCLFRRVLRGTGCVQGVRGRVPGPATLVLRCLQAFASPYPGVPLQPRALAVLPVSGESTLIGVSSAKMARPASTCRQESERTIRATRSGIRMPGVWAEDHACCHDPTGSVAEIVVTRGHVLP